MGLKLNTVKKIVSRGGLPSLAKKSFRDFFLFPLILAPICYFGIEKIKKSSLDTSKSYDFCLKNGKIINCGQIKSEILPVLNEIKDLNPKIVMEIGTARGGNLFLLSQVADKDAHLISLDLPFGNFGGGYRFWKIPLYKSFAKKGQKITLVRKDSHNEKTLQEIKEILGDKKIDFLFIDGDHTYEGVKKDFEWYSPLVKEGGVIAFHDIVPTPDHFGNLYCEVYKFWDEIKKNYKHKEFVEDWDQKWAGIGLLIK
jgi:predicted O-methyltransferase YrrM